MKKLAVEHATPLTSSTGASFEKELSELLRVRTRLIFAVVFIIAGVAAIVNRLIVSVQPAFDGGLVPYYDWLRAGHLASFAIAFGLTFVLKGPARHLQLLAFWTVAINLVLAIAVNASFQPAEEPYLVAALCLFLYAVFIPSPARYTVMLGTLAVVSFLFSAVLTYVFVPEAQAYWADVGVVLQLSAQSALRNHLVWGVTGIAILAFVAHLASRTLYSLRQAAHEAERLGNYVVEEELGAGGMGQVFRARHSMIRRPTAVKVMQATGEEELAAIKRFEREVQLSATLTHPNTITIYDFGHTPDNRFYYAMEYLEGLDLQGLVDRFGPVGSPRTAFVLAQASGALSEAHERGIIHRDIKPSNIFLTRRGGLYDFVKVLDFGLAKQITDPEAVSLTKTGVAVGTPRYISPEAIKGSENIDARSDIYCLGSVAYFMLTGRPPFDAKSSAELLIDHLKATPPRPSHLSELPISAELEEVVMKCLEKSAAARFQTTAELELALRELHFDEPWSHSKAREWWELHGLIGEADAVVDLEGTRLPNGGISRFIYEP
jgi:serine/threonine-protein kinase